MAIVVDTDILIDLLREKEYAVLKIEELEKNQELATTDINAFEPAMIRISKNLKRSKSLRLMN